MAATKPTQDPITLALDALEPFANVARQIKKHATDGRWLETPLFFMGDDTDPHRWTLTGKAFNDALKCLEALRSQPAPARAGEYKHEGHPYTAAQDFTWLQNKIFEAESRGIFPAHFAHITAAIFNIRKALGINGHVDQSSYPNEAARQSPSAQPDRTANVGTIVPEGMVIVPLECTDEIAEAIAIEARCCGGIAETIWHKAMMAATAEHESGVPECKDFWIAFFEDPATGEIHGSAHDRDSVSFYQKNPYFIGFSKISIDMGRLSK